ncbi:MAG: hypothetical protein A2V77_14010 [Anaeromyxobacter sp. RBG_16_69_14]|nr:MAG: hypothetical protein A2V77_14010 [Anaeromyxobacter sp. RBG_16_69_14]
MSETITCPSGLSGRIRGMKAREERVLADRKLARSGAQLEQIPAACWEETIDAGPYDFGELALALESGLAPVQGRLAGLAALRVRSARAAAAAALGDRERAEIGAVTAWTLVGSFGALHALEIDRRFAPEEGTLPESTAAPAGLPPVPARAIPCPDGTVPGRRASQRRHLLPGCRGPPGTRRGVPPHRRRYDHPASVRGRCAGGRAARLRRLPTAGAGGLHHARTGRHRLLLKIGRGEARALLGVSLARADDGAADATFAPAAAALPGAAVHRRATPPARARRASAPSCSTALT